MQVSVRPEVADHVEAIDAIHRSAFEGPVEAELVAALRSSDAWVDDLSLVATDVEGRVVGHVLLTRATVDGAPVLALAPVGVLPLAQGQGVGMNLIVHGLLTATVLGEQTVVVLGDPAYYGRFGFTPARAQGIMPPDETWPDAAFQARALTGAPLPQGVMAYAAPFGV